MIIKFAAMLLCGLLFWLGGRSWGNKMFRRIGVPVLLALYVACALKAWWLFLACGVGFGFTIPIGYGEPSQDDLKPSWLGLIFRKGWLIRGMYGLIVTSFGAVALVLGHFLPIYRYLLYIALNFALGAVLCRLKVPANAIEPVIGAGFGSLVLFL